MTSANSTTFRAAGPATDALAAGAPQWTAEGGDWDEIAEQIAARDEADRLEHDRVVVNMGPVHPSTHGVLRLVLETDCPYLAPVPNRGKRNSSYNLPYVADAMAEIKGLSREEIIRATNRNAKQLYRLAPGKAERN